MAYADSAVVAKAIGSRLSITGTDGREVVRQSIADRTMVINTGNLSAGVYLIRLTNDKTVAVEKIIKQ